MMIIRDPKITIATVNKEKIGSFETTETIFLCLSITTIMDSITIGISKTYMKTKDKNA
jgi:hypothetical protein